MKSLLVSALVFGLFACGGGSCSSCAGCGVEPIPGGYPIADRIDNSAQIRLTESGIQFVEDNIDGIVASFLGSGLDFPVPRTTQSFSGISFTICSSDACTAHAEIENVTLSPMEPNHLEVHLQLVLDSRDASGPPGARGAWPGTCDIDLDTRRGGRTYVGIVADLEFATETEAARAGYTRLIVQSADLASGEDIENADLRISGGFLGSCALLDLGFIKGLIIDQLTGSLSDMLTSAVDDQLCQTQGDFGCPTGTVADGADPGDVCRFTAGGRCVPLLLGTDGQGDLGAAFLGSTSPGTHAPGQFLLAAGGDGEAVANGMTLNFFGGWRGTDRSYVTSPAHNPCVPMIDEPPLPTIAPAAAFRGNTIPGTGGDAHVGIGLSEQYLNHVGYGLFDSGMLCLGVGTRLSQQISTGLFSVLISSLRSLAFPEENAPLSFALRPQLPPVFEVGAGTVDEPLLTITLPELEVDFYVWSTERYVRFMTYKADLSIPLNLRAESGELVPEITEIGAAGSSVTNSELLSEDPASLATLIETVIQMFAGMLTGGLGPIALPDLAGFELAVPEGGIGGVAEGDEEFLGIWANLALAPPTMPLTAPADTSARLVDLRVDPGALALETFGEGEWPVARLHVEAEGPAAVEYEYATRVDAMTWSPYAAGPWLEVSDRAFLLQARHEVEVRARVVGEPLTADLSPARVEVLIDALAPQVTADRLDGGVRVDAFDVLSPGEGLQYRARIDGGAWSAWEILGEGAFLPLAFDDEVIDVEVRDEAGNVGRARAALIRGLPEPGVESSCGCNVPGGGSRAPLAGLALLLALGLGIRRRRRLLADIGRYLPTLLVVAALLSALALAGCDCGGDKTPPPPCNDICVGAMPPATNGSICCEMTDMCVVYDLEDLCDPGFVCSSPDALVMDESCGLTCDDCMRKPALEPGLLSTHLDFVVAGDGRTVVSGYSPGVPPTRQYGDLVIGVHDPASGNTDWEIVDGAPSSPITNDPDGWRGGVSAPGDDVGRWTGIAEAADGTFYVSYYDRTNGALKLAMGQPGSWNVQVVDDTGDSGRYASIALDLENKPVIAYMRIREADDGSGRVVSSAQVAMSTTTTPSGPPDWVVTEVGAADMPCREGACATGETCLESGLCVTPSADCAATCADGEACHMGACEAELPSPWVEDMPPGYGLHESLVVTASGLALVFYDRTAGNLMGASWDGATWTAPFLIDGYASTDPDVGDSGIGASLTVDDAGVWHVTYVDGAEETLRYARVEGGTPTTEVVDDGSTNGADPHPDGRHIVGDDSSVVVTATGLVRVAYQDATSQRLMFAERDTGTSAWSIRVLDMADHTGFWVEQQLVGDASQVLTWWRNQGESTNGIRVLNP